MSTFNQGTQSVVSLCVVVSASASLFGAAAAARVVVVLEFENGSKVLSLDDANGVGRISSYFWLFSIICTFFL